MNKYTGTDIDIYETEPMPCINGHGKEHPHFIVGYAESDTSCEPIAYCHSGSKATLVRDALRKYQGTEVPSE